MRKLLIPGTLLFLMILSGCVSVEDMATARLAEMLSSESTGSVFSGDEDPVLVGDALPVILKMYEILLASRPEDPALNAATGKNFIMYANAYIQTPAGMLPDEDFRESRAMLSRAKQMYLRGRNYLFTSLELTRPGFLSLLKGEDLDPLLSLFTRQEDADLLYWCASSWIAAYSCDPFDFELAAGLAVPVALLFRGLQLNPEYNRGAIHDVLIQVYASLPEAHLEKARIHSPAVLAPFLDSLYRNSGDDGSREFRARFHFEASTALSGGTLPGPYIALAQGICIPAQDSEEFLRLLTLASEIDPEEHPENRLAVRISRDKALWLLEHVEDYFLLDIPEDFNSHEEVYP